MTNKSVGLLTFNFGANMQGFDRAMNKAQKKLKKFGRSVTKTGKSLSMGLTVPIVALGAASLKTFADFEQGMLKVKAISGATEVEFKALTESAKKLGSSTMFTASQVAELQLNLSKLGLTAPEINESTEAILNLAQATDSDLAEAATVAASVMNAFGLEAKDMTMISDVMADAFSSSALDLVKFQTAMASVAPVANQAGADIQRTSAILGVLVNNGIEASSAGTALRNVFIELAIQGKTWDEAMNEITSDAKPLAKAFELFGKKGASVATIIAGNSTEIQALTADFNDSAGEAKKMAEIMDSGVAGAMRKLRSQTEGLLIQLGTALLPTFKKIAKWLSSLVEWFSSLSSEQKDNMVKWGLIAAAMGPVLMIIGKMATGISALMGLSKTLLTTATVGWIALAGVVAMAANSLYDYLSGANKVASKQDILNGINAKAEGAIVGQRLEVERLTEVLEDENSTLEVKTEALNKLKELSPEYYGQLKIAKGDVEGLTQATNDYIDSILEKAKAQAAEERLIEIEKELLNIETKRAKAGSKQGVAYRKAFIYTEKNRLALTEEKKALSGMIKERMQDTEVIKEETEALEEQIKVEKEGGKKMRKVRPMRSRTPRLRLPKWTQEMVEEGMKPVEVKIHFNIIEWMSQGEKIAKVIEGWVDKWSDKIQGFADMASQALSSVAAVASALSNKETVEFENNKKRQEDALETSYNNELAMLEKGHMTAEEFTIQKEALDARYADSKEALDERMERKEAAIKKKQAKRDKALGIMSAIIDTASAVVNALASLPFPANIVMAAVIGGMGAAQIAIMASTPIPEFAEGGLVTGPTSALIGEASSASNPEVVAPLDKLKGFMAGAQQVEVVGTIQGTSIVLSSAKTNINRLRSV